MLFVVAFILTLISATHDSINAAIESYKHIESYRLTLKSTPR